MRGESVVPPDGTPKVPFANVGTIAPGASEIISLENISGAAKYLPIQSIQMTNSSATINVTIKLNQLDDNVLPIPHGVVVVEEDAWIYSLEIVNNHATSTLAIGDISGVLWHPPVDGGYIGHESGSIIRGLQSWLRK